MNINDGVFRRNLLARSWKIATLQFIPTVLRHEHFVIFPMPIVGYLKTLVLVYKSFDVFNIGIDRPEISILELARIYKEQGKKIIGYSGKINFSPPPEKDYMIHNPNRRCPVIDKARKNLGYAPKIDVATGVGRFIQYLSRGI